MIDLWLLFKEEPESEFKESDETIDPVDEHMCIECKHLGSDRCTKQPGLRGQRSTAQKIGRRRCRHFERNDLSDRFIATMHALYVRRLECMVGWLDETMTEIVYERRR